MEAVSPLDRCFFIISPKEEKKARKAWELHDQERRRRTKQKREKADVKKPKPKMGVFHYLPNPPFSVIVGPSYNRQECRKVAVTWVYRDGQFKWVLLQTKCYNRILGALAKLNFVQHDSSAFSSPRFDSRVSTVKLFKFFDPVKRENDPRFFWVQTHFSPPRYPIPVYAIPPGTAAILPPAPPAPADTGLPAPE